MRVPISRLQCKRCSYQWVPRRAEVRVCPSCHSPYWDRDRASLSPTHDIQPILDETVKRIVKTCDPEKIILFGSHAAGTAGPDSDLDLLVVTSAQGSCRKKATQIDVALFGIPLPVDTIVVTPEQVERRRDVPGEIIQTAIAQGQTLYERAA